MQLPILAQIGGRAFFTGPPFPPPAVGSGRSIRSDLPRTPLPPRLIEIRSPCIKISQYVWPSTCGKTRIFWIFFDLFFLDFLVFSLFFKVFSPFRFSGPPRGICTSGESSGDLNLTDFVPHFHVFFVKNCAFIQFFRFFAIRIASWQPRTLPGRQISKFSSTGWS